jgi:DNA-binding CsgD family transcriptional regulator
MGFREREWGLRPEMGPVQAMEGRLTAPFGAAGAPHANLHPLPCSALHGLLGAVLDELDHAVLICAPTGRLLAYNRCAHHTLGSHPHLSLHDEVLSLRGTDPLLWAQALRQAGQGRRSLVPMGEGAQRQYLACTPLGASGQVLVLLGRDRAYSTLAFEMFCAQHALTHAERRVLLALVDGQRPADMAESFGVALSTVRTQVANIRAKLGAARIESLMQMAAGLPPLATLLGTPSH